MEKLLKVFRRTSEFGSAVYTEGFHKSLKIQCSSDFSLASKWNIFQFLRKDEKGKNWFDDFHLQLEENNVSL